MNLPLGGQIDVGGFSPMKNITEFKAMYRNVSKEEIDKAFDNANKTLKDKGFDSKQIGDTKDMIGKGFATDRKVEYLEDVGEISAVITAKIAGDAIQLITLYKGNTFQILVDIDQKTKEENLEVAKKVAKEVLKKCK